MPKQELFDVLSRDQQFLDLESADQQEAAKRLSEDEGMFDQYMSQAFEDYNSLSDDERINVKSNLLGPIEAPPTAELVGRAALTAIPSTLETVGGAMQAGEELFGTGTKYGEETGKYWRDVAQGIRPKTEPDTFESYLASAVESIGTNLPGMIAGGATGKLLYPLLYAGGQTAAKDYGERRSRGFDEFDSALSAFALLLVTIVNTVK